MLVDMNNAKSRSGFENDAAAAPNAATATPSPIPARRRASKRTFDLYTNTEAKLPTMIATIANTSIVFRCFELRSFPIKSIDARDRKSVVQGKSVSVRVDLGGRRIIKKKKNQRKHNEDITN